MLSSDFIRNVFYIYNIDSTHMVHYFCYKSLIKKSELSYTEILNSCLLEMGYVMRGCQDVWVWCSKNPNEILNSCLLEMGYVLRGCQVVWVWYNKNPNEILNSCLFEMGYVIRGCQVVWVWYNKNPNESFEMKFLY